MNKLLISLIAIATSGTAMATTYPKPVHSHHNSSVNASSSNTNTNNSSSNSSVANSGNSKNKNKNVQSQTQNQTARGGKARATGGSATSSNGDNTGTNVSTITYEATRRAAASAYAAPLTSSNDTCMGSTSGGISTPGFGISGGSTWTDENCVMLKNSRELWNMGFKEAALARLCMDSDNREALEASGIQCPIRKTHDGSSASNAKYTGNDNIVRARLGLPPVPETN